VAGKRPARALPSAARSFAGCCKIPAAAQHDYPAAPGFPPVGRWFPECSDGRGARRQFRIANRACYANIR